VVEIRTARRSNGILLGGIILCVAIVLALSRMFASSPDMIGDLSCGPSESSESASHREPVTTPQSVVGSSAPKESTTPAAPIEDASERRPTNPSAMIDGLIVDARTREPIPFLDVKLVSTPVEDPVRTDKDGAFHSTRALPLAHLSAVVSDGGRMLKTFVRAEDMRTDMRWTIELAIGPTYPLVIDSFGALDPSQWTARVIETTRNFEDAGEIDVDEHHVSMRAPLADAADHAWQWLALRTEPILVGDVPWIRYPSMEHQPDKRYRMRIQVRSDAVGQTGLARIRATIGVQEPVIVDGLREIGVLAGRLVDANDAPVNGGTLMLLPRDPVGEGDHTPQWDVVQANRKGEFRCELAALGHRDLLVFAPRLPVVEMPVVVTRGITTLAEPVRLPRSAPAGMVDQPTLEDSRARGRRGERREMLVAHVRLPQAGRFARDWVQALPATLVRSHNASLDPSALPDAPLDLEWIDLLDSRGYSKPDVVPMHMSVAAPVARIEVGSKGARQSRSLHVATGEDPDHDIDGLPQHVDNTYLCFEPGGALVGEEHAVELQRWELLPGTALRWSCWRWGSAPVFGDESAFQLEKGNDRRVRRITPLTARVDFAAGWGAVLWCRASEGASPPDLQRLKGLGYVSEDSDSVVPPLHKVLAAPPLPDVRVLADGVFAGKSDAEGVIRIALARQPLRLVLVADRWHMTRLERVPGAGVAQRYVVWMDRDE
jgi:hypothetical protein